MVLEWRISFIVVIKRNKKIKIWLNIVLLIFEEEKYMLEICIKLFFFLIDKDIGGKKSYFFKKENYFLNEENIKI